MVCLFFCNQLYLGCYTEALGLWQHHDKGGKANYGSCHVLAPIQRTTRRPLSLPHKKSKEEGRQGKKKEIKEKEKRKEKREKGKGKGKREREPSTI